MFVILFLACSATATSLSVYLPESFLNWLLVLTITSTKAIGFLLGLSVTSSADLITVNGFAMRIITQCTALHYVIILASAILLYTRHSIRYRITGLLLSVPFIILVNAIRLIVTGLAGGISLDAFVLVHEYLWVFAFSLLILGIWVLWADNKIRMTYIEVRHGCLKILICTVAYAVLYFVRPYYGQLMAKLGSPVFKVLIGESHARIDFDGTLTRFVHSGGIFTANFMPDFMVSALFVGLMLTMGPFWQTMLKRIMPGLLIIMTACVGLVSGGGSLAVTSGMETATVFLWTGHGVLLSLSMCLCWLLQKKQYT